MKKIEIIKKAIIIFAMVLGIGAASVYTSTTEAQAATSVSKVTGVETTVKSTSSVKISWSKVSGATGYQVYQRIGKSGTWTKVKSTSSTSYTATSLKSGKTYYYKVRAYKKSSSKTTYGSYSSAVKYTGGTPAKTTGLSLTVVKSSGSMTISWTKVSGADGYKIYRKTSGGEYKLIKTIKSGSTTSYTSTGLASGTKYYYKVRAYNKTSSKTYYGSYSTVKSKTAVKVTAVSGTALSETSSGSVKVSWTKMSTAGGYQIYRKTSGGSYKLVKTISSASTTSWTDSSAEAGTTYAYKIRAYKKANSKTYYGSCSSSKSITLSLEVGTVSGVSLTQDNDGIPTVSWSKVSGASGYQIYRKVSGGDYTLVKTISSGSTTSWEDTTSGLKIGKTYYYKVRAYVKTTSKTWYGSFSSAKSITLEEACDHDADSQTIVSVEDGMITYKCSDCGETYTKACTHSSISYKQEVYSWKVSNIRCYCGETFDTVAEWRVHSHSYGVAADENGVYHNGYNSCEVPDDYRWYWVCNICGEELDY